MMGELNGKFRQFCYSFLLNILKKIVPERNKLDSLEVKFNFLTIRSVDNESFDLNIVVFAVKYLLPHS